MAVVKKESLKKSERGSIGEKEISLSRSSCRDSGLLEQRNAPDGLTAAGDLHVGLNNKLEYHR